MKLLMLLLLVSCANTYTPSSQVFTSYDVTVDAVSAPQVGKYKTFILKHSSNDLRSQDLLGIVSKGLAMSGLVLVQNVAKADLVIQVSFSVSAPQVSIDSSPVRSHRVTQIKNSFGANVGSMRSSDTEMETETITRYKRVLELRAFHKGAPVWGTKATSIGRSDNLRTVFPFLIVATVPKIGTSTVEKVEIYENDANAEALRTPASN